MPLYIAQSGDLDRCYRCLTDRQTTLKDRATQLLIKYKSEALVTQCYIAEVLTHPFWYWKYKDVDDEYQLTSNTCYRKRKKYKFHLYI